MSSKCDVNACGPDSVIKNQHFREILDNIQSMKDVATGLAGAYPLQGGVGLAWVNKA